MRSCRATKPLPNLSLLQRSLRRTLELLTRKRASRLLKVSIGPSFALRGFRQREGIANKLLDTPCGGWVKEAHLAVEFLCDAAHGRDDTAPRESFKPAACFRHNPANQRLPFHTRISIGTIPVAVSTKLSVLASPIQISVSSKTPCQSQQLRFTASRPVSSRNRSTES